MGGLGGGRGFFNGESTCKDGSMGLSGVFGLSIFRLISWNAGIAWVSSPDGSRWSTRSKDRLLCGNRLTAVASRISTGPGEEDGIDHWVYGRDGGRRVDMSSSSGLSKNVGNLGVCK